jgi:hypothetical protein
MQGTSTTSGAGVWGLGFGMQGKSDTSDAGGLMIGC